MPTRGGLWLYVDRTKGVSMTSIIRAGHGGRHRRQAIDMLRLVASVSVGGGVVEHFEPTSADPIGQPLFLFCGCRLPARSIDEAVQIVEQSGPTVGSIPKPQWNDNRDGVRGRVTQIRTR